MIRPVSVALAALVLGGCVPVAEPLSDIHKAEPDAKLVGKWTVDKSSAGGDLVVDHPAVKGNPKGLMRVAPEGPPESALWFFCTTIEKKTYASVVVDRARDGGYLPLDTPGEFAKWEKSGTRGYIVFQYTLAGDKLVIDISNETAIKTQFAAEKYEKQANGQYHAPGGAFAKFLARDAAKLFTGENTLTYKRAK